MLQKHQAKKICHLKCVYVEMYIRSLHFIGTHFMPDQKNISFLGSVSSLCFGLILVQEWQEKLAMLLLFLVWQPEISTIIALIIIYCLFIHDAFTTADAVLINSR